MTERILVELELLRVHFPDIQHVLHRGEHWFRIPAYPLNGGPRWTPNPLQVAFHAQPNHPGQAPYGIYVPSGVLVGGAKPHNVSDPASKKPPFPGRWAVLSWTADGSRWRPMPVVARGSNLLNFALGFGERFSQGR